MLTHGASEKRKAHCCARRQVPTRHISTSSLRQRSRPVVRRTDNVRNAMCGAGRTRACAPVMRERQQKAQHESFSSSVGRKSRRLPKMLPGRVGRHRVQRPWSESQTDNVIAPKPDDRTMTGMPSTEQTTNARPSCPAARIPPAVQPAGREHFSQASGSTYSIPRRKGTARNSRLNATENIRHRRYYTKM